MNGELKIGDNQWICINMLIENENKAKVRVIPLRLQSRSGQLNIQEPLHSLLPLGAHVQVYDFSRDTFTSLEWSEGLVPLSYLDSNAAILLVRIKEEDQVSSISERPSADGCRSENSSIKRERSKERTIFEVIDIVKQWRELHTQKESKVSLQEAAQILRLPKKSLDDYYYQLKLGQKHGFNFRAHLTDRIGVLRTYLKTAPINKHDKGDKHPKKLKIIEEFGELVEEMGRGHGQQMEQQLHDYFEQDMRGGSVMGDFEFVHQPDPFLAYNFDFKKKEGDSFDFFG